MNSEISSNPEGGCDFWRDRIAMLEAALAERDEEIKWLNGRLSEKASEIYRLRGEKNALSSKLRELLLSQLRKDNRKKEGEIQTVPRKGKCLGGCPEFAKRYGLTFHCCGGCHDDCTEFEHSVEDDNYFLVCCSAAVALKEKGEGEEDDNNEAIS